MFPEDGTREEFRQAVLKGVVRSYCIECLNEFVADEVMFFNNIWRCPTCVKKMSDQEFWMRREGDFHGYTQP